MMANTLLPVDLTGQVAVVTGGGRGLGRVIAERLAASGAAVAVVGRSAQPLEATAQAIQQSGGRALALVADVADRQAVEHMVQTVEQRLGPIDVLVNNAAIMGKIGPLWESDPDAWWEVMDINVRGAFLCSWAVLPGMVRRKRGRVVNVASDAGLFAMPYATHYCVSKAAMIRLTDCLAQEVREHGVAVFVIHPGLVRTAMTDYLIQAEESQTWLPGVGQAFAAERDVPPDPAADLVALLASGQADALTGRFIFYSDDVAAMLTHTEQIRRDDLHTMRLRRRPE
jgi:NAD(P)-dependent dehydrogenase (short-subunit alcohol dehydrogenase family)